MVYAQPSDMIARYPNRDLVQLTNEDPTQQVVDDSVLQQALADASAEIDGYLESRFTLPLSDAPAVLARLTCDIAMYRLQALRPLHDLAEARRRYEDAVAVLVRVADGTLTLGLAPDNQEPGEAAGSVVTEAGGDTAGTLPRRVFSRGNLKGF
ncbi:MAG: gp436 family protein [Candidatus Binataceae bacterium]|jgi:phage gp36-like protein